MQPLLERQVQSLLAEICGCRLGTDQVAVAKKVLLLLTVDLKFTIFHPHKYCRSPQGFFQHPAAFGQCLLCATLDSHEDKTGGRPFPELIDHQFLLGRHGLGQKKADIRQEISPGPNPYQAGNHQ